MTPSSLQRAIENIEWYHDFDFGNGLRATSRIENVDAIRPVWRFIERQLESIDFRGKSVLEIGAWDGYWSFHAERRGAARVVATDDLSQNWGSGRGIHLAKELLASKVEIRQDVSIYDLARLGETFDIIICLGVFYHLHDPLCAFSQIRHRCHAGSVVLLEGSLASSGVHKNEVRYFHDPSLEFLASASALSALLKASYLDVGSQAWMQPWSHSQSMLPDEPLRVDRAFLVCNPFSGINDMFHYRPMFGLGAYDPRFAQGLRAQFESVDAPATVEPGQRFTARLRAVNAGSCRWTATPAPDDYESMFLAGRLADSSGDHAGVTKYRHYLDEHGLKGTVAAGVHLFSDGGGMIQRDYARGFFPSDVPDGEPIDVAIEMQAPQEPGIYLLVFDMVAEYVNWFEALGSSVAQRYLVVGSDRRSPDIRASGI